MEKKIFNDGFKNPIRKGMTSPVKSVLNGGDKKQTSKPNTNTNNGNKKK